ncbi:MAG TPA: alpha/beta hydrolase [Steroidobacteraceae bacterium]|nr:alpha/beta hydrolase [Steroidobacteraceae bacterium]
MKLGADVVAGEDVPYGKDPYQRLLIYRAAGPNNRVLAFLHGGGWTNGYKEWMAFMAPALTGAGITFVSIGYRLAPGHVFPLGLEDCADGLMATRALTECAPLFVGGHSAGGHYASLLAVRDAWWRRRSLPANPLRGCLPISGAYNFGPGSGLSSRPRFLGTGDAERAASPMIDITDRTPFLISYGEHDFPHLIIQANMMHAALQAAGTSVEVLVLPGCDHFESSYVAGQAAGIWPTHASSFMTQLSE